MRILTFNCFLVPLFSPNPKKRILEITNQIKLVNPDMVFLQEVPLPSYKSLFIKNLSTYPFHYLPKNGCFRTGGGLAVFSKFPIIKKKFTKFRKSGFWTDITFFDKLLKKGFMEIEVKDNKGRPIYFFNTHLTVNYEPKKSKQKKKDKRITLIEEQIHKISLALNNIPKNKQCFILGDFNFNPSSNLYENFVKMNFLADLSKKLGFSMNKSMYKGYFHFLISKEKIDYAFYKGKKIIKSNAQYVFNKEALSDHKGLLLDIK